MISLWTKIRKKETVPQKVQNFPNSSSLRRTKMQIGTRGREREILTSYFNIHCTKHKPYFYLRFWNHTLICLGSILERMGHSLMSCCLLKELGLGHSEYTLSKASTCSGVYLTYLLVSICCLLLFVNESLCITSAMYVTHQPPHQS